VPPLRGVGAGAVASVMRSAAIGSDGARPVPVFCSIHSSSATLGTRTVRAPVILTVGRTPSCIHRKASARLTPNSAATSPPRSKSLSACGDAV
jgi:hypothetical protein